MPLLRKILWKKVNKDSVRTVFQRSLDRTSLLFHLWNPPFSKEIENHPCGACTTHRKYFTMARALGAYEGSLQEAIHRWKYEGKTHLTPFFVNGW